MTGILCSGGKSFFKLLRGRLRRWTASGKVVTYIKRCAKNTLWIEGSLFFLNVCINRLLHIIIYEYLFGIGEIIKKILFEFFEIFDDSWSRSRSFDRQSCDRHTRSWSNNFPDSSHYIFHNWNRVLSTLVWWLLLLGMVMHIFLLCMWIHYGKLYLSDQDQRDV